MHVNRVERLDVVHFSAPVLHYFLEVDLNSDLVGAAVPDNGDPVPFCKVGESSGERDGIQHRQALLDVITVRLVKLPQHRKFRAVYFLYDHVNHRVGDVLEQPLCNLFLQLDSSLAGCFQFSEQRERNLAVWTDHNRSGQFRLLLHKYLDYILRPQLVFRFSECRCPD